ncbi:MULTISPECIES: arylesterase [Thalassospira]|uniref:Arylesterase n=1 Tax=Thalassospira aquimaris TaxID=3037796 RepID=A0ABT6GH95_9PROT|nr:MULTISPECIES: arylesterase [Thalassospira]MDG4721450.1 arylesterase [Thalassospira sp. FZY0004]
MNWASGQGRTVIEFTALRLRKRHFAPVLSAILLGFVALFGGIAPVQAKDEAPQTIVLFGDSLMAGYGLSHDDGFAPKLEAALKDAGHDVRVINSSVSGDTSAAGLARLDWALVDKPDAVLLELGANDALRGVEPSQTRDNLAQIIEKLRAQDVDILLAGMMAPPNMGAAYGDEFNSIYPDLAGRYEIDFYPFFLDGVAAEPTLNQDDGMHPNADGVGVIVERILPNVINLLDDAS